MKKETLFWEGGQGESLDGDGACFYSRFGLSGILEGYLCRNMRSNPSYSDGAKESSRFKALGAGPVVGKGISGETSWKKETSHISFWSVFRLVRG
jgi:hypothetical protein